MRHFFSEPVVSMVPFQPTHSPSRLGPIFAVINSHIYNHVYHKLPQLIPTTWKAGPGVVRFHYLGRFKFLPSFLISRINFFQGIQYFSGPFFPGFLNLNRMVVLLVILARARQACDIRGKGIAC